MTETEKRKNKNPFEFQPDFAVNPLSKKRVDLSLHR